MKDKLIIKNFGPINFIDIELSRFNVLIGENATGKSTVAKVLATCRYFSYIIKDDLLPNAFEDGLKSFGLAEFIKIDTYVFYECEHYSFQAKRILKEEINRDDQDGSILSKFQIPIFEIELSEKSKTFIKLRNELKALQPKDPEGQYGYVSDESWIIPASFIQNDVASVLDSPFYLPTERGLQSIFSLGKNSIQNIADSLFSQLADLDLIARSFKTETIIEPLNIFYKNVDGRGYIKKNNENDFYSLYNGASGYKSAIPIVLAVKYYNEMKKKIKTYIVEEPELNLFPAGQKKLTQHLVNVTINYENSILLTTHSPYILTSLNNLMYAYNVGNALEDISEVEAVINKKYWIDANDVSAYLLKSDGTSEDIINRKESMIDAHRIDEISTLINEDFDELINIELGINHENN